MTITNTNRAAAKAGTMQAGQPVADSLPDLLNFDSTAAGVRVGDLLRDRLDAAERAEAAHAAGAESAQLAGDDAERQHADEAARLGREVARLHLAIEKADARLADVAAAERQAAARAAIKAARADVERAEEIAATLYPAAARTVAALLGELTELQASIRSARADARDAGMNDEAAVLQLPHERRSTPGRMEEVEVTTTVGGVSITDSDGNSVAGFNAQGRTIAAAPPVRATRTHIERRHVPGFLAPDISASRCVLPDPNGGRLLDRGEDR